MQATIGTKRFFIEHSKMALLAATLVLAIAAGSAALTLTGHGAVDGSNPHAAVANVSAQPRQVAHPSDRPFVQRDAAAPGVSSLDRADRQAQRFNAKLAQLEADELHAAASAAQATAHAKLLHFNAHKEAQILSMTAVHDAPALSGLDRADAITFLRQRSNPLP
jgi:hypothetical protein